MSEIPFLENKMAKRLTTTLLIFTKRSKVQFKVKRSASYMSVCIAVQVSFQDDFMNFGFCFVRLSTIQFQTVQNSGLVRGMLKINSS